MANVRLLIAYDGTDFRGLAPNDGVRTVVGELQRVIEPLIGEVPDIIMSGRTDAGVHAWGQVLSFRMADGVVDTERIQRSANTRLGPEIVVREASIVDDDFSARFSATGRRYRYHIVNRPVPDPFWARTGWWLSTPLDVPAMERACAHLVGEHDFSSFCRRPKPAPNLEGEVVEASLVRRDDVLRFEIEGSAFCHQMVRSIVGFLAMVGTGKRDADELPDVLAARDRSAAEQLAPGQGLTLWQVDYAD
ncbi:UNVERIFIED_CONTAM: hypothetical protein GTU68_055239 [Idotea baltica]|nr:hypothetical protein [Idotea baltica]